MTRFARSLKSDAVFGLVVAIVGSVLIAGVVTGAIRHLLAGGSARNVTAVFNDTRQLAKGDPVRIDGVDVGSVSKLVLDGDRHSATVTLGLNSSAGPLYRDASAAIRFRTLLGGNFYVDLTRGTPGSGQLAGSQIPRARTSTQVEVDDITTLVKDGARTGLQTMPSELAKALRDPTEPAGVLRELASASPALTHGLAAVRGEQPSSDVQTLVSSAQQAVTALDAPAAQLRTLVAGTAALVQVTAARSADLVHTLDLAPGVMARTNTTLTDLDGTLRAANPLLDRLIGASPLVAPAVAKLRGAVIPTSSLLHTAVPLLDDLRPAVEHLAAASAQAQPLLSALSPSLTKLNETILPYTGKPDPQTQHSMAEMVGPGLGSGLGSVGDYADNLGGFVRFPVSSGNTALYLPCQTYFSNPDLGSKLLACEQIQTAVSQVLHYLGGANGGQP